MSGEHVPAYIGRLRCGCIRAATVAEPNRHLKDWTEALVEWAAGGLILEYTTVGFVRTAQWDCGRPDCEQHSGACEDQVELFAS